MTSTQHDARAQREDNHPLLRVHALHKTFRNGRKNPRTLFRDLSFDIDANEVVGIIGHSGSGKSTILNLIAGLDRPDRGVIEVNGKPIEGPGSDRMVVFQHYGLLPWLTVAGNVRLAIDETMPGTSARERDDIAQRYVDFVGLSDSVGKHPHELSGGMRQRVGIARALAVRPLLLLMDEPFGSLDPFTRGRLQDLVLELFYREHQTILLITHDVDEALFMCDRILLLEVGEHSVIAKSIRVPFAHPRNRSELRENSAYFSLRNEILSHLEHSFAASLT